MAIVENLVCDADNGLKPLPAKLEIVGKYFMAGKAQAFLWPGLSIFQDLVDCPFNSNNVSSDNTRLSII
jgi:hypothetical protein